MVRNKRGMVSVFVMIFSVSIISLAMLFIGGTRAKAISSSVESLGHLWAKSILGEYTDKLYERYGIFAYKAKSPVEVDDKLNQLSEITFKGKRYIDCEGCNSSLYRYSLAELDNFQKQVNKAAVADKQKKFKDIELDVYTPSDRRISNDAILAGLPSKGRLSSFSLSNFINKIKEIDDIKDVLKGGKDEILQMKYMKNHFQSAVSQSEDDDSFFKYELEYILAGKASDEGNLKSTRNRIIAIREAMNIAYINQNPQMRDLALTIAELISSPAAAPATQQALIAAWAYAESVNDYRLLVHGKKVPLMKDDDSWAVNLKSIITNPNPEYIDKNNEKGNTYNEYLQAMIFLTNKDNRLLRMMDLIEINMKYCYYGNFSISSHYTGIDYSMDVNGRTHNFSAEY
ncbi:MAG: hypothetical protein HXM04_02650 [[Eubacterium] sulci]|jgi:hypothetical protein|nr:hypothetical protein [[Eubacterium] sulci]